MFIIALCTIAKLWKQPRYPTTNERLMTMGFYSAIKKNEFFFAEK
jgi:hypothetical protein